MGQALPLESATLDLTTLGSQGTVGGAWFFQGPGKAGTGVWAPFLRTQANTDVEEGYNTSLSKPMPNVKTGSWTHDLKLGEWPIAVHTDGEAYYVVALDINQTKASPLLSMDKLEVWLRASTPLPNASTYALLQGGATKVYDMDATDSANEVLMNFELAPGSGVADLVAYLPVNMIGMNTNVHVYLYCQYGAKGGVYTANDGFEEWAVTSLPSGQSEWTYTNRVGDQVWYDNNLNNVKDVGENGIVNVRVFIDYNNNGLYDSLLDRSVTTDASGYYSISNVAPGSWSILVDPSTLPAGLIPVHDLDGTNTVNRTAFTITTNQIRADLDFGYVQAATLGNRVWNDINNDGLLNNGESGIDGVVVQLFQQGKVPGTHAPYATTTTATVGSNAGFYSFENVPPGNYFIYLPTPPASAPLSSTVTDTVDNQQDNDDNGSQPGGSGGAVSSPVLTLSAGETDNTVDFGFYSLASLGNLVWEDVDNDGTRDAGEAGFDGVTVELWRDMDGDGVFEPAGGDNQTPLSTVTAGGGLYGFSGVHPGQYFVVVPTPPANHTLSSTHTIAVDNQVDNDDNGIQTAAGASTVSPPIILSSGEVENTVDFGFIDPGVGNLVWLDLNNNGHVDAGEPGIADVMMEIYRPGFGPDGIAGNLDDHDVVATTTTDANGNYLFQALAPASYQVRIPVSNFAPGGALEHYPKASAVVVTSDNQVDDDNNGSQTAPGMVVTSPLIALEANSEPVNGGTETGRGNTLDDGDDADSDLTVDFGFAVFDFGDLPDTGAGTGAGNYQTTLADNGPRHVIGTLRLGGAIDRETDGQPNAAATGDDTNGAAPDDEDGITVPVLVPGVPATFIVNSSGAGWLNAFFDWNADGDFADSGEVLAEVAVVAGNNYPVVPVPAGALMGTDLGARFRLSTAGGLGATGLAEDGEVEDLLVRVSSPTAAVLETFRVAMNGAGVLVSWRTDSEAGVAGYAIYRAGAAGEWILETLEPVLAGGRWTGRSYAVLLPRPPEDAVYELVALNEDLSEEALARAELDLDGSSAEDEATLRITGITRTPGGVRVRWQAKGAACVVERTPHLGAKADWQPVAPATRATEIETTTGESGYFRVRRVQ